MRSGRSNRALAAGVFGLSLLGTGAASAETDKPQVRRHARGRHRVRDADGAVMGPAHDWNWKHNHDTGQFYEQLFAADLTKSANERRPAPFYADAWLPSDAIRGELAESWEWKENPLRVEIKLRKGIMFPEKPGVMASRELVADDVVFTYNRLANSPKPAQGLLRPRRQGRGDRQAHGGVHLQGVLRRVGLPVWLGLLLRHLSQGGGRRRRRPTGRTSTAAGHSC